MLSKKRTITRLSRLRFLVFLLFILFNANNKFYNAKLSDVKQESF